MKLKRALDEWVLGSFFFFPFSVFLPCGLWTAAADVDWLPNGVRAALLVDSFPARF